MFTPIRLRDLRWGLAVPARTPTIHGFAVPARTPTIHGLVVLTRTRIVYGRVAHGVTPHARGQIHRNVEG